MEEFSQERGATTAAVPSQSPPAEADRKGSYGQIVKSSALVGGSSLANVVLGIIRTKAMALMLGPSGFGLMGLYVSIIELAQSIAATGLTSSGVRQVAESAGSGDVGRVARSAVVLRRISIALGLAAAAVLLLFCKPLSILTFGSTDRAHSVALLSLAVCCGAFSAGQTALIQGLRRIGDLAKVSVFGGLLGTLVSIPLVYFFRERGLVPALVCVAAVVSATSWWYARKVKIPSVRITHEELKTETLAIVKLGAVIAASSLLTMGAAYIARILVARKFGLDAAGLYQAAWVLGGLYVGFILQSMGADFYPRLTGQAHDNRECNRLVNEQAQVSLLLAVPGILGTLTFAPLIMSLFYSERFSGAVDILRWICLGMALRVTTWPMGFILLAKGARKLFFCAEVIYTTLHLALAWACLSVFGVNGIGIAFFGSYILHWLIVYPMVRRLTDFHWSSATARAGLCSFGLVGAVFASFYLLPTKLSLIVGLLALLISVIYSVRSLLTLTQFDNDRLRKWLIRFRLAPASQPLLSR